MATREQSYQNTYNRKYEPRMARKLNRLGVDNIDQLKPRKAARVAAKIDQRAQNRANFRTDQRFGTLPTKYDDGGVAKPVPQAPTASNPSPKKNRRTTVPDVVKGGGQGWTVEGSGADPNADSRSYQAPAAGSGEDWRRLVTNDPEALQRLIEHVLANGAVKNTWAQNEFLRLFPGLLKDGRALRENELANRLRGLVGATDKYQGHGWQVVDGQGNVLVNVLENLVPPRNRPGGGGGGGGGGTGGHRPPGPSGGEDPGGLWPVDPNGPTPTEGSGSAEPDALARIIDQQLGNIIASGGHDPRLTSEFRIGLAENQAGMFDRGNRELRETLAARGITGGNTEAHETRRLRENLDTSRMAQMREFDMQQVEDAQNRILNAINNSTGRSLGMADIELKKMAESRLFAELVHRRQIDVTQLLENIRMAREGNYSALVAQLLALRNGLAGGSAP